MEIKKKRISQKKQKEHQKFLERSAELKRFIVPLKDFIKKDPNAK